MGRHGKTLRPTADNRFRNLGPVDMEHLLTAYEKRMLSESAKQDIVKKSTDTVMAACSGILLYHFKDLAACRAGERLQLFYSLFKRFLDSKLEHPDERQQFAEWYWTACTDSPLIRATEQKEYKMAKKYSQELSTELKKRIDDQGYDLQDICPACGITKFVYHQLINGGSYSKKAFDAVADYVGLEMDDDVKAMYNTRFNVGNNSRTERMEDLAAEIEAEPPVLAPEEPAAEEAPAVVDPEPEVEKVPVKMPAEAEEPAPEPEPAEDEERPYADVNPMYTEAKPSDYPAAEDMYAMSPDVILQNLDAYKGKLPELREDLAKMLKTVDTLKKFIKVLEILQG